MLDKKAFENVFPKGEPKGDEAKIAFEQYKIVFETLDRVRQRRRTSNAFFVSLNTLLTGLISQSALHISNVYIYVAGVILSILWIANILNYRGLDDDKRLVLITMERILPASPFTAESERRSGRRWFTCLEIIIALVFLLLYGFALCKCGGLAGLSGASQK